MAGFDPAIGQTAAVMAVAPKGVRMGGQRDRVRRLQGVLDDQAGGDPGIMLAVEAPSLGLGWAGATGRFALTEDRPLSPDDPFRAASVTKAVTAATVLRLAESGRLALDDALGGYLPATLVGRVHRADGVSRGASITLRQLLNHTSGVYDYVGDDRFVAGLMADPSRTWTPTELVEQAIALGPPSFPPGAGFRYSDTGYVLLGLVVEAVTAGPLHGAYRGLVLDPLGMDGTHLERHEAPRGGTVSHAYLGDVDLAPINTSFDWGGGGLVSTAGDLIRLLRGLFGGPLLGERWRREMTAWVPQTRWEPESTARYARYGLGVGANEAAGEEVLGATGAWGAFAYYWRGGDAAIAGTVNRFGADRAPLLDAVVGALKG